MQGLRTAANANPKSNADVSGKLLFEGGHLLPKDISPTLHDARDRCVDLSLTGQVARFRVGQWNGLGHNHGFTYV
jgi:hypothetical protein